MAGERVVPEVSRELLKSAIERVLGRESNGSPLVQWQGEEMMLLPVSEAVALVIAADAAETLSDLLPKHLKLSE